MTAPTVRRRTFTDKDGDTFTAAGTLRRVTLTWENSGASIVFRAEDAQKITELILEVRPNEHE